MKSPISPKPTFIVLGERDVLEQSERLFHSVMQKKKNTSVISKNLLPKKSPWFRITHIHSLIIIRFLRQNLTLIEGNTLLVMERIFQEKNKKKIRLKKYTPQRKNIQKRTCDEKNPTPNQRKERKNIMGNQKIVIDKEIFSFMQNPYTNAIWIF